MFFSIYRNLDYIIIKGCEKKKNSLCLNNANLIK